MAQTSPVPEPRQQQLKDIRIDIEKWVPVSIPLQPALPSARKQLRQEAALAHMQRLALDGEESTSNVQGHHVVPASITWQVSESGPVTQYVL